MVCRIQETGISTSHDDFLGLRQHLSSRNLTKHGQKIIMPIHSAPTEGTNHANILIFQNNGILREHPINNPLLFDSNGPFLKDEHKKNVINLSLSGFSEVDKVNVIETYYHIQNGPTCGFCTIGAARYFSEVLKNQSLKFEEMHRHFNSIESMINLEKELKKIDPNIIDIKSKEFSIDVNKYEIFKHSLDDDVKKLNLMDKNFITLKDFISNLQTTINKIAARDFTDITIKDNDEIFSESIKTLTKKMNSEISEIVKINKKLEIVKEELEKLSIIKSECERKTEAEKNKTLLTFLSTRPNFKIDDKKTNDTNYLIREFNIIGGGLSNSSKELNKSFSAKKNIIDEINKQIFEEFNQIIKETESLRGAVKEKERECNEQYEDLANKQAELNKDKLRRETLPSHDSYGFELLVGSFKSYIKSDQKSDDFFSKNTLVQASNGEIFNIPHIPFIKEPGIITPNSDQERTTIHFKTNDEDMFKDIEEVKITLPQKIKLNQDYINKLCKEILNSGFINEHTCVDCVETKSKESKNFEKIKERANNVIISKYLGRSRQTEKVKSAM